MPPTPRIAAVITTIQEPTPSVRGIADALRPHHIPLYAIGDQKGPFKFDGLADLDTRFYPLSEQLKLPFTLVRDLPTKHYARKNLGYLLAIRDGATCLYETDDDNAPDPRWKIPTLTTNAQPAAPRRWMNVYRCFTDQLIWPRGLPLAAVRDPNTYAHDPHTPEQSYTCPIQQGLADLAPDVDAVWRLILDREFTFNPGPSVHLPPGTWCPFNSQNTWWFPDAFPLLYLPSYCSFRMTDIWRSFIAQRCLWELGAGLVFHPADVIQQRNLHNLTRDFADEVDGYLKNDTIVDTLTATKLQPGPHNVPDNLLRCYHALVTANIFPEKELPLVRAWTADLAAMAPFAPGR